MSSLIDNKLVQIALVVLAFYVILQITNNDVSQEHMDTVVNITPPTATTQTAVNVEQHPLSENKVSVTQNPNSTLVTVTTPQFTQQVSSTSPALSAGAPQPSNALTTPELSAAHAEMASAKPVVTSAPSAALSSGKVPSPLTSVQETLLAAAPPVLPAVQEEKDVFAPDAIDVDEMFSKRTTLDPSDLIPKTQDAELYSGLQLDPAMNQNFLQNRWSLGIDASAPKRNFSNDLRGAHAVPLAVISPFGQPTQMPDLYRKTLGEIS